MSGWLLFPTSAAVLYVGGQIMALTFRLIDAWTDSRLPEPRNHEVKLGSERGD